MDESILTSVKKKIGMAADCTEFDDDIIDHINSVFMILTQLGVGPSTGFAISDSTAVWSDFIPETQGTVKLRGVRTYVGQKVKLIFDPPQSGAFKEALNQSISEFEWRLKTSAEFGL